MRRRRFSWLVSDIVRKAATLYLEWSARLRGQRFYCAALAGRSDYNITINCDLTVSCSCQDYDGSGHLGDLNRNTFSEVFYGPVAERFREELAKGKLPIKTCARCSELRRVPKKSVKLAPKMPAEPVTAGSDSGSMRLLAGPPPRLPYKGMLLENTVRCNLACLGCDRESAARTRSIRQMDLEKMGLMAELVKQLKLEKLFYLNLGEPFLSANVNQELRILREKNPDCNIVISTNGIVLNSETKREGAMFASEIYFSVAGIDEESMSVYEPQGGFDKAYGYMKDLVTYRNSRGLRKPLIFWKYLLFNWNDKPYMIARAIEMAREAGVDAIYFAPTSNPFYGISWRYRLGFFNQVGVAHWRGREVWLGEDRAGADNDPRAIPAGDRPTQAQLSV